MDAKQHDEPHAGLRALCAHLGEEAVWRFVVGDRCTVREHRIARAVRQLARDPERRDWTLPSRPHRLRVLAATRRGPLLAAHDVDPTHDDRVVEVPVDPDQVWRIAVDVVPRSDQTHETTWLPEDRMRETRDRTRVWTGRTERRVHVEVGSADDARVSRYELRLTPGRRPAPDGPNERWALVARRAARAGGRTHYPVPIPEGGFRLVALETGQGETDLEPVPPPHDAELARVREACRAHWREACVAAGIDQVRVVARVRRHKEPKVWIEGLPDQARGAKVALLVHGRPGVPDEWHLRIGLLAQALCDDARHEARAMGLAPGRRGRVTVEHDCRAGGARTVRGWGEREEPLVIES